jgi:hypothetical protein
MRYTAIVPANREELATQGSTDARETLRILLTAHCELTEVAADQAQQLRALLLRGDGADRTLGRGGLAYGVLAQLAHRRPPREATEGQVARFSEIQRLAEVLIAYRDELAANREHMAILVNQLAPGITAEPGMGPFKAAKAILDANTLALPNSSRL